MSFKSRIPIFITCLVLIVVTLGGCKSDKIFTPNGTTDKGEMPNIVCDDNPVSYNIFDTGSVIQYSDGFFYFLSLETGNGKRLMRNTDLFKYNSQTAGLTYVCQDPVCEHNTPDCPLFGHATMFFYKNKLFFDKNYKYLHKNREYETFMGFASYDMVSGELNKLNVRAFEVAENPTVKYNIALTLSALYVDNYRYYYETDYNEKLEAYVKMLKRMHLNTGEITILDDSSNTSGGQKVDLVNYLFGVNGRLYFTDTKSLYSTDLDYKDKKTVAEGVFGKDTVTNGKVIVWKNSDTNELHTMNMDGTNSRSLGIKASSFKLNEKSLYYFSDAKIELGIVAETGEPDYLETFELFRYSFETEKSEQLLNLKNDDDCTVVLYWEVVNNCLYASYFKWTLPKAGETLSHERHRYSSAHPSHVNTILRVDLATGEQSFIELAVN